MEVVVASIHFIKSHALNHHQFKAYLTDWFSDYENMSLIITSFIIVKWDGWIKVKWFYDLRQDIPDFMEIKGNN